VPVWFARTHARTRVRTRVVHSACWSDSFEFARRERNASLARERKRAREEEEREGLVRRAKAKRSFLLCMAISHGSSSRALGFSLGLSRRSDRRSSWHGVAYAWRTCHQNEDEKIRERRNNARCVMEARSCRYECVDASARAWLGLVRCALANE